MDLIVVRHAETDYNAKKLINGTIDEPLSEAGREQLPHLVDSLQGEHFDMVYTSPLQRAMETAAAITNRYHVPLKQDADLIEVNLGSFNGQPIVSTIPVLGLGSSDLLSSYVYDFSPYGGERASETETRIRRFLDHIKQDPQTTPLIVTHGGVIRWFYYLCTGEKHGRVHNASVHHFTWQ